MNEQKKLTERFYANKTDYLFEQENDGWWSIYEIHNGKYIPIIQSKDLEHCKSFCVLREPADPRWIKLC